MEQLSQFPYSKHDTCTTILYQAYKWGYIQMLLNHFEKYENGMNFHHESFEEFWAAVSNVHICTIHKGPTSTIGIHQFKMINTLRLPSHLVEGFQYR